MKIAVCIKQVPDSAALELDPVTHTLRRDGAKAVLNPLDEFALEMAVQLKRSYGGTITAFTMGPPQAESVLKRAVSMGADDTVLLSCREFAGADTWATSLNLAQAIRKHGPFDILLFGKQATDGDTAQVGPGVAAHLGIPQVTYATSVKLCDDGRLEIRRLLDNGTAVLKAEMPVALTILKEANEPGFPSLAGYLKALQTTPALESAQTLGIAAEDTGLQGSPTRVANVKVPENHRRQKKIGGTSEHCAEELVKLLKK